MDVKVKWDQGPNARFDLLITRFGVSSIKIAEVAGVSKSLVTRWRAGGRVPRADELATVLQFLGGSSADEILGLKPSEPGPDVLRRVVQFVEQLQTGEPAIVLAEPSLLKPLKRPPG